MYRVSSKLMILMMHQSFPLPPTTPRTPHVIGKCRGQICGYRRCREMAGFIEYTICQGYSDRLNTYWLENMEDGSDYTGGSYEYHWTKQIFVSYTAVDPERTVLSLTRIGTDVRCASLSNVLTCAIKAWHYTVYIILIFVMFNLLKFSLLISEQMPWKY